MPTEAEYRNLVFSDLAPSLQVMRGKPIDGAAMERLISIARAWVRARAQRGLIPHDLLIRPARTEANERAVVLLHHEWPPIEIAVGFETLPIVKMTAAR